MQTMQQRAQQLSLPPSGDDPAQLSGFGEQALVDWLNYLHLDAEVRWFPCPHTPPLVAIFRLTFSIHWNPNIAHHAYADIAGAGA